MAEGQKAHLEVAGLWAGYGKREVLRDVSLSVAYGETVAVIGHNGAGKSTLLRAVFGVLPIRGGHVYCGGAMVARPEPRVMLGRGVAYLPQGGRVFYDLMVRENIEIAGMAGAERLPRLGGTEAALAEYPELGGRMGQRAGALSGGERQMLALAMSRVMRPRMMLMDEPSVGLAPSRVAETFARIRAMTEEGGLSVLIVEQRVREVLAIADRVVVLKGGRVSFAGRASELKDEERLKRAYL